MRISMAYIPSEQQNYDILPAARQNGWEVFAYDSALLDELRHDGCDVPYPYHPESYEAYYAEIDKCILQYPDLKDKLLVYKNSLIDMNDKHRWGIIRYHGPSDLSFTDGRYYYVPIFSNKDGQLRCGGIIDDEEFTDYIAWVASESFELDRTSWFEIIVDPNGLVSKMLE